MADSDKPAPARAGEPLSAREREVLGLAASGLTNTQIAEQLGLRVATVKTHLVHVYTKTGVKNRVQATRYYLDHLAPR